MAPKFYTAADLTKIKPKPGHHHGWQNRLLTRTDSQLQEAPHLPYRDQATEAKAKSFLRRGIPVVLTGFPCYEFDFERYHASD